LKGKDRLLNADRGKQDNRLHASLLCCRERMHMGLVINRPRIPGRPGARSQTRDQRIESFTAKAVALERRWVRNVPQPNRRTREQALGILRRECATDPGTRPHETDYFVPTLDQGLRSCNANGACGPQHHHPPRIWRARA
jgi:hypothetical protein